MDTYATVSVTADDATCNEDSDEAKVYANGFDRARVTFPAEDGGDTICQHCREAIEQDGAIWELSSYDGDSSPICEDNDDGPHEPETGPGTWCNSAAVIADDTDDSVTVTISVGDPRGAFAFTVRKVPTLYEADGATVANPDLAGRLLLHVPHPGEGMAHMELSELHPGTFLVG